MNSIKIHPLDNVAVALCDIAKGEIAGPSDCEVIATEKIGQGHKIALVDIPEGSPIIKYGNKIGIATEDIAAGSFVHTHNVKTALSEKTKFEYRPEIPTLPKVENKTFMGFRRAKGKR